MHDQEAAQPEKAQPEKAQHKPAQGSAPPSGNLATTLPLGRFRALDFMRFVAVTMMVQGHTFTALIEQSFKPMLWYRQHAYVHGFTAPLFFFSSGLAFGVTSFRKWQDHTQLGPAVRKRLARYAWLIFIGYSLNLPNFSLARLIYAKTNTPWNMFFKVDALHHIAVVLIACELLIVAIKKKGPYIITVSVLGFLAILLGPWAWRQPAEQWLPHFFVGYFNTNLGSIFPLIPWMGFICAGLGTAWLFLDKDRRTVRTKRGPIFVVAGIALWFFCDLLWKAGFNPFGEHNFWKTSPLFFGKRLGILLGGAGLLASIEEFLRRRREGGSTQSKRTLLELIGQETLIIYVVHLLMLYGSPVHVSLVSQFAHSLTPMQCLGVFLGVFVGCVGFAILWNKARARWPQKFPWFRYALAGMTLLYMALVD